jgi:hypothetical protein
MFNQKNTSILPYKSRLAKGILGLALAAQLIFVPGLNSTKILAATNNDLTSPDVTIYSNGPLATGATTKSGVAAPAGTQWSEVQNNAGDLTVANTNAGFSCGANGPFRCADNFVVPVGQTWTINQVAVYGYQTGAAAGTSPFTAANLQIWNGRPGDTGSTVIFGDTTTNRLASSTNTNIYRIFNTVVPPATAPGTTRIIWQNNITVGPALVLTAGNYWIDFQLTASGTGASFTPPVTIVNTRFTPIQNGRQFTTGAWIDLVDAGQGTTPPTVPQDLPFILDGTIATTRVAPPISRTVDFNGDNKSDYAVARSASLTAATTWYILTNGGTATATPFGVGVGFAGGDVAVPADYDGDGKSDIAVWRPLAVDSRFFILQSQTNTLRTLIFGQPGDDPTVTGDYDGDGRADPAVYRNNPTAGGQNYFYYRTTTGAANNINQTPFGVSGDKPYPGDFDGDGKYDFAVIRNNGGNAQHFQLRSTQGYVVTFYGLFTDRFVTADFDGDFKNDLVAVRNNGGAYNWYVATSTSNQFINFAFGSATTDYITPGDYDGDNRTDFAVFRSGTSGVGFYQIGTLSAPLATPFGASSANLTAPDYPVAAYQVH